MKTILKFISVIIVLSQYSAIKADWPAYYTGLFETSYNEATAIAVDNSGNSYVTGTAENDNPAQMEVTTIKYNSSGVQQWVARYSVAPGTGLSIIMSSDQEHVFVTGKIATTNQGWDFVTIKYYTSNGGQNWASAYNGPGNDDDVANKIVVDASDNVYVTGRSMGDGTGKDFVTIKYNSSGTQQWVTRYDDGDYDIAYSLKLDNNYSNVYVTGQSSDQSTSNFTTIKYNSSGTQQWVKTYDNGGVDCGTDIAVNSTYGVYVTGTSYISGGLKSTVIKYNTAGDELWVNYNYSGTSNSIGIFKRAIGEGPSSYTIDVFTTGYGGDINNDFYGQTIRYNNSGTEQWCSTFNNQYLSLFRMLKIDNSENIIVTGYYKPSNLAYLTVKYNSSGVQQWAENINNGIEAEAYGIDLDASGNAYVTGCMMLESDERDYVTMKYSSGDESKPHNSHNSEQISSSIPNNFELYQNYPNPFNPVTKIKYGLPVSSNVKITVFDLLGKEIKTLLNSFKNAGYYEVEFNASNLSSGVYFYKLQYGYFIEMKKMILIK
jgi:hypothetical protein